MQRRLIVNDSRKLSYSMWGGLVLLLLLALASFRIAYAQSGAAQTDIPKEAQPFLVERSRIVDGKRDPRFLTELRFGEARENCTVWRFEMSAKSNGHAVVELKEPDDKKVLLNLDFSPQSLELVLGDADCNYRIRIERNK